MLASITTASLTLITDSTAVSGGNVTASGGGTISARGIVWNTSVNPTIALSTKTTNGAGTGVFSSNITGLTPGTIYYVRAYVTNNIGTNYGNELTFTSLAKLPTVTTKPVTAITSLGATSGGTITNTGGATHSEKGVVYATTTNPTVSNNKSVDNTVGLDWISTLTGLTGNTKYYIRAYATNVIGTAYGVLDSFTTLPIAPIITTNSVTTITDTSAVSGGNISSDGGSAITARGIVWNKTGNPIVGTDSIRTDASSTAGSYTLNLGNLNSGITYYVRAYAINVIGTSYGNQLTFTTLPVLDTIGNQYTTITINGEEWFRENLKTNRYANGDTIENVPTPGDWGLRTSGAWAYYNNDISNNSNFGKLYNWYAVSDVRGLCPTGWHVATDADWTSLSANYGTDAVAGKELKATALWTTPNTNTNSSGFGALPGGGRGSLNFGDLFNKGFWWTNTAYSSAAWARRMEFSSNTLIRYSEDTKYGFSVRCVKD